MRLPHKESIMKRLLIIAVLLLAPQVVSSQEKPKPAPKPAVTSSMDTNKDGKVDAKEMAAATKADASVGDVMADGAEVVDAVKDMKDGSSGLPNSTLLALLLGVIFKLLLSGMKVAGKNIAWFKSKDGKRVIKYSTLGLGAAAALCANLAFGMHWMEAAQLLLSGPIAVAIHEYTKDSKDPPA
jgi:hypothetical protein